MVALLPTQIPAFASAGTQFNPGIRRIPADERARHPDIRIATSDWGPFFDEVIIHPTKYGLTDTTAPCAGVPSLSANSPHCASPETHFFYFTAHPSTAAHRAVGDLLYKEATRLPHSHRVPHVRRSLTASTMGLLPSPARSPAIPQSAPSAPSSPNPTDNRPTPTKFFQFQHNPDTLAAIGNH